MPLIGEQARSRRGAEFRGVHERRDTAIIGGVPRRVFESRRAFNCGRLLSRIAGSKMSPGSSCVVAAIPAIAISASKHAFRAGGIISGLPGGDSGQEPYGTKTVEGSAAMVVNIFLGTAGAGYARTGAIARRSSAAQGKTVAIASGATTARATASHGARATGLSVPKVQAGGPYRPRCPGSACSGSRPLLLGLRQPPPQQYAESGPCR